MESLSNPYLSLMIDPDQGVFSIKPAQTEFPSIEKARMGVLFCASGLKKGLINGWKGWHSQSGELELVEHGRFQQVTFQCEGDARGIHYEVQFALAVDSALMLWRVKILNDSHSAITIRRIDLLREGKLVGEGDQPGFYSNGWQSWSYSGSYGANQTQKRSYLGPLQAPMTINPTTPRPHGRGKISSDFYGVIGDRRLRTGWVVGFLAQRAHFGSLQVNLGQPSTINLWAAGDDARLDVGSTMQTDWAAMTPLHLDAANPLDEYLNAVARENHVKIHDEILAGWCSWYEFYQKVTEADIERNLQAISSMRESLPLSLVQIDDGFEAQIGDWFDFHPQRFPNGVEHLAEEIRAHGLTPGIWLAPFIVHTRSKLFHEHPDYILRNSLGRPVNAGFVWDVLNTALDLTYPPALEYATSVVARATKEWGYPYLKLDFLYAGGLPGKRYDPTQTRASALRKGMEALREAVSPGTYLLGCGSPLGSSIGLFDAMRIGADVSGYWRPVYNGMKSFLIENEPNFPSARCSLQNILSRAQLHQKWWTNDPDCLLVRENMELTLDEVMSLAAAISITGGSLLLSDNLPGVGEERMRIAESLLPVIGKRAQVLDWFDESMPERMRLDLEGAIGSWSLLTQFNWQDAKRDITFGLKDFDLTEQAMWVHNFWSGEVTRLEAGGQITCQLPAHGNALFAIRPVILGSAQYLGSDIYIAQGLEVSTWEDGVDDLRFTLSLGRVCSGRVRLALPFTPANVWVEGQKVELESLGGGVFVLSVQIHKEVRVIISR